MEGLTVGRIVHYVPDASEAPNMAGECVAAMVVRVWDKSVGMVNLTVFPDWSNSGIPAARSTGTYWATSRIYDESIRPRPGYSWHWPKDCDQ